MKRHSIDHIEANRIHTRAAINLEKDAVFHSLHNGSFSCNFPLAVIELSTRTTNQRMKENITRNQEPTSENMNKKELSKMAKSDYL